MHAHTHTHTPHRDTVLCWKTLLPQDCAIQHLDCHNISTLCCVCMRNQMLTCLHFYLPVVKHAQSKCLSLCVCAQVCLKAKGVNGRDEGFDGVQGGARDWCVLSHMTSAIQKKKKKKTLSDPRAHFVLNSCESKSDQWLCMFCWQTMKPSKPYQHTPVLINKHLSSVCSIH